jgi:hypothetical protein
MIVCIKYIAPSVELVRLQMEGVIAESYSPVIPSGEVKYTPYENVSGTQDSDVLLF